MSDDCVINRQPHHPAFWLYAFHIKQKSFFCMREKTKQSLVVKAFIGELPCRLLRTKNHHFAALRFPDFQRWM
jgi:hypothetical protein